MNRRIRLNPCDYFTLGRHVRLLRQGQGGNIAYMVLEIDGRVGVEELRRAMRDTILTHPVLLGGLRYAVTTGRPYWRLPRDAEAATRARDRAWFRYLDLRRTEGWEDQLEEAWQGNYAADWDLANGPLVQLEYYDLPRDRTRLCLRWPHCFMDAEGAQLLLAEIEAHLSGTADARASAGVRGAPGLVQGDEGREDACDGADRASARENACGAADRTSARGSSLLEQEGDGIDVLAGRSFFEKVRLVRDGLAGKESSQKDEEPLTSVQAPAPRTGGRETAPKPPDEEMVVRQLVADPPPAFMEHRALHRFFSPEEVRAMQDRAKAVAPPGPALYARHLVACTIRAQHRLYQERGLSTDAYLVTFPVRVALPGRSGLSRHKRPFVGNYLASVILCARRETADDRRALGDAILRQINDFQEGHGDVQQWALMWAAAFLRPSMYQLVFRVSLGFERLTSGFSYYGEVVRPLRSFGGRPIVNFFGGGPLGSPPGLNPVFSKFADRLNLSLTWNRPAIADDVAKRYADLIRQEVTADG